MGFNVEEREAKLALQPVGEKRHFGGGGPGQREVHPVTAVPRCWIAVPSGGSMPLFG